MTKRESIGTITELLIDSEHFSGSKINQLKPKLIERLKIDKTEKIENLNNNLENLKFLRLESNKYESVKSNFKSNGSNEVS